MIDWLVLLARLGVTDAEPTLETLQRLQRQALLSFPFENLDIHLGRPILLDHTAIYLKIVVGDRGGFCYELNECFYQCLKALGYDIDRLEGRVVIGGPGAPFDHQCALVRLDGVRWWVDIGFGDSTLVPRRLLRDLPPDGAWQVDEDVETEFSTPGLGPVRRSMPVAAACAGFRICAQTSLYSGDGDGSNHVGRKHLKARRP